MGDASLLVYQMEKGVFFQGNIESFVCEMDLGKCSVGGEIAVMAETIHKTRENCVFIQMFGRGEK